MFKKIKYCSIAYNMFTEGNGSLAWNGGVGWGREVLDWEVLVGEWRCWWRMKNGFYGNSDDKI